MISEHVTVETGGTKLSRRFSSAVQGDLRPLEKGEIKKVPELYQGGMRAPSHDRPQSVPGVRRDDGASQRAKG